MLVLLAVVRQFRGSYATVPAWLPPVCWFAWRS